MPHRVAPDLALVAVEQAIKGERVSTVRIETEEQALEAFTRIAGGDLNARDIDRVEFSGWPKLHVRLSGPQYHGTLTPTAMNGFVELQRNLHRSFAATKYGKPSGRYLTREEKRALEIEVKVEGGSSNLDVDVQQLLMKMIEMVGAKMEPTHVVTMVLGIAILYFGKLALKDYLENRRQERAREASSAENRALIEHLKFASAEETNRTRMISELVARDGDLVNIARNAYDARTALVRSVQTADDAAIQDVPIDGDVAHELTRNARRQSVDVRLDGNYRILRVDSSDPTMFKVKVVGLADGQKLDTSVQDKALTPETRALLQNAEWERTSVYLEINAHEIGSDQYKDAIVLSVAEPRTNRDG